MLYDYSCMYLSIDEGPVLLIWYNRKKNNQPNTNAIPQYTTGLTTKKFSLYECGFDPVGSVCLPFSIKSFLVAITFLLFDLEIALLLPLPWASQTVNPKTKPTVVLVLISRIAGRLRTKPQSPSMLKIIIPTVILIPLIYTSNIPNYNFHCNRTNLFYILSEAMLVPTPIIAR
ncbi:hypothetical protein HPG69_008142 [Diceros bicornis minor]|uniref:NADH-ubiquinone oxidoreductase chain 3 n=1 Tax=Diceros bicornis minor TaxID=77932 RepID=A0A7J7F6X7_DICBM|nr:hypothetical protein HPG69_008142 [Diceros bicornis minor]